jgi:hypothetical protein
MELYKYYTIPTYNNQRQGTGGTRKKGLDFLRTAHVGVLPFFSIFCILYFSV